MWIKRKEYERLKRMEEKQVEAEMITKEFHNITRIRMSNEIEQLKRENEELRRKYIDAVDKLEEFADRLLRTVREENDKS